MNIAILSRGPQLYSTQALALAAEKRGHHVSVIDNLMCSIIIEKDKPEVYYGEKMLWGIDAIIPRIGASVTFQGAAIIRQFEMMKIYSTLPSEGLLQSRDKLRSMQLLSMAGIGLPKTAFTNYGEDAQHLIDAVGGTPLIIKLLKGTHGLGVILAENNTTASSVIESFNRVRERVIVQEFIAESNGADVRAFVVDGKIVAAMKRKARPGEFRSNLHRGATAIHIKLTSEEERTALKAVKMLGLKVAGVDMLQSDRGPLVLEVNPSPGLEGISTTTGIDVAGQIIELVEREVAQKTEGAE